MPPSSRECSPSRGDPTYRGILSRKNPDITDKWDGSICGRKKKKVAFDKVVFSEEANCTIQECTEQIMTYSGMLTANVS